MNDSFPKITYAQALKIKERAKVIRKQLNCSHIAALNIQAESFGYRNWEELTRMNPVSRSAKKEL